MVGASTVIVTVSAVLDPVPSSTMSEKTKVSFEAPVVSVGAVKVGCEDVASDSVTVVPEVWVQA